MSGQTGGPPAHDLETVFLRIADRLEKKVDELDDAIAEIKEAAAVTRINQMHIEKAVEDLQEEQDVQEKEIGRLKTKVAVLALGYTVLAGSVGAVLYIIFEKLMSLVTMIRGGAG